MLNIITLGLEGGLVVAAAMAEVWVAGGAAQAQKWILKAVHARPEEGAARTERMRRV